MARDPIMSDESDAMRAVRLPCADCVIDAASGVSTPDEDHAGSHPAMLTDEAIATLIDTTTNRDPFRIVGPYRSHGAADRDLLALLARDLYELHLRTGISLDSWHSARAFVTRYYGAIKDNGA